MNILRVFLALFWLIMAVSLFFGYEPKTIIIGFAFLISSISHLKDLE